MPIIEEEVAVPYTEDDLKKLFGYMGDDERFPYRFFLEQDATTWGNTALPYADHIEGQGR